MSNVTTLHPETKSLPSDELLTVNALAAELKRTPNTVRRYISNNKLPPFDQDLSQQQRGWKRSTLVQAGIIA